MDPITMAIAGGLMIGGGVAGGIAAGNEAEKANALLDQAIQRINALEIPDLTKEIIYQQYTAIGDFSPIALDQVIEQLAPAALIQEDPIHKIRQQVNYNKISQMAETGVSQQQKLQMETARRKAAQDALSQMASIESQAKQRGQFGGGQALALRALAASQSADRQAMENMQAAAMAGQNQFTAMQEQARQAETDRGTSLGIEEKNVAAKNLRDELRAKYSRDDRDLKFSQDVRLQQARNKAMQDAAEKNVATSQAEALRRGYTAPLEMARLKFDKEKMVANLMGNKANVHSNLGASKANMWSDIGGGAGKMVMAAGGMGGKNTPKTPGSSTGGDRFSLGADTTYTSELDPNLFRPS